MTHWRVIVALAATYIAFAILLNSVGTVILQAINTFNVSKLEASVLEGLKDLPIAVVGFLIASFLPRFGYKNALLIGTAVVTVASFLVPLFPTFFSIQIRFFMVGCAFGIVKVSVYSTVGLVTKTNKEHASLLNIIDGIFMLGVLFGYWLFAYFIAPNDPTSIAWTQVYWSIGVICATSLFLVATVKLDESEARSDASLNPANLKEDFMVMVRLMSLPLVYIFVLSAFIYVLIEQGIGSWLPTFNNEVFKLSADMSVQFASIYAAALALGRFSVGLILRKVGWYPVLNVCLVITGALIFSIVPATENIIMPSQMAWDTVPFAVFLLPMIGLVMAPIYPAINSAMLCALPKSQHAAMTGLIVIFSALGGTTGSVVMGFVFQDTGGTNAFLLLIAPVTILLVTLYLFKRNLDRFDSFQAKQ